MGLNNKMKTLLPAVVLSQFPLSDQFNNPVAWERFRSVPKVLVMSGQDASQSATAWGIWLQNTVNTGFKPSQNHLQFLDPREHVKIIAVASLPNVPKFFKNLFRAGFRRQASDYGVALDFSSSLSHALGYDADDASPGLAVLPPGSPDDALEPMIIRGPFTDPGQRQMLEALSNWINTPQPGSSPLPSVSPTASPGPGSAFPSPFPSVYPSVEPQPSVSPVANPRQETQRQQETPHQESPRQESKKQEGNRPE